jgi:hypothetical protein
MTLFFLLSAYLITELWLREQELCGKLDLRFFCLRRNLRISRPGARRSPLARATRPRVLIEQVFGGHSCPPLLILDFDRREPDGPVGFAQARV